MHQTSSVKMKQRCEALLDELNLRDDGQNIKVEPLTGGVSSDIALVTLCKPHTVDKRSADRKLCVKFAREKLKVAADWFAPVHRNAAEYAWLQVAARCCTGECNRAVWSFRRTSWFCHWVRQ